MSDLNRNIAPSDASTVIGSITNSVSMESIHGDAAPAVGVPTASTPASSVPTAAIPECAAPVGTDPVCAAPAGAGPENTFSAASPASDHPVDHRAMMQEIEEAVMNTAGSGQKLVALIKKVDPKNLSALLNDINRAAGDKFDRFTMRGVFVVIILAFIANMHTENHARFSSAVAFRMLPECEQKKEPFYRAIGMGQDAFNRGLEELQEYGLSVDFSRANLPGAGRSDSNEYFHELVKAIPLAFGISEEALEQRKQIGETVTEAAGIITEARKDAEEESSDSGSLTSEGTENEIDTDDVIVAAKMFQNLINTRDELFERLENEGIDVRFCVSQFFPSFRKAVDTVIEFAEKHDLWDASDSKGSSVAPAAPVSAWESGSQSAETSGEGATPLPNTEEDARGQARDLEGTDILMESEAASEPRNTSPSEDSPSAESDQDQAELKKGMVIAYLIVMVRQLQEKADAVINAIGRIRNNTGKRTRIPHARFRMLMLCTNAAEMKRTLRCCIKSVENIEKYLKSLEEDDGSLNAFLEDLNLPVINTDENGMPIVEIEEIEEGIRRLEHLELELNRKQEKSGKGSSLALLLRNAVDLFSSLREWLQTPVSEEAISSREFMIRSVQAALLSLIQRWTEEWNSCGRSYGQIKQFARTVLNRHRSLLDLIRKRAVGDESATDPKRESTEEIAKNTASGSLMLEEEILSAVEKGSAFRLQAGLNHATALDNLAILIERFRKSGKTDGRSSLAPRCGAETETGKETEKKQKRHVSQEALEFLLRMQELLHKYVPEELSDDLDTCLAQGCLISLVLCDTKEWLEAWDSSRTEKQAVTSVSKMILRVSVQNGLAKYEDRCLRAELSRMGSKEETIPDVSAQAVSESTSGKDEAPVREVPEELRASVCLMADEAERLLDDLKRLLKEGLERKKESSKKESSILAAQERLAGIKKDIQCKKEYAEKYEDYYIWLALRITLENSLLPKIMEWRDRCMKGMDEGRMPSYTTVNIVAEGISGPKAGRKLEKIWEEYNARILKGDGSTPGRSRKVPVSDDLRGDVKKALSEFYSLLDQTDACMEEALGRRKPSSKRKDFIQDARKMLSELRERVQETGRQTDEIPYSYAWSALRELLTDCLLPEALEWKENSQKKAAEGCSLSYTNGNNAAAAMLRRKEEKRRSEAWEAYGKAMKKEGGSSKGHYIEIRPWESDPFSSEGQISMKELCSYMLKFWNEGKVPTDIKTWLEFIINVDFARLYGDPTKEKACCRITGKELSNALRYYTGIVFSGETLRNILVRQMGYAGRQSRKLDQVGEPSPYRDAQFKNIKETLDAINPETDIIFSVDTKAFIILGRMKRDNMVLMCTPGGAVYRVKDHDYAFLMREIYPNGTDLVDASRMEESAVLHPVGVYCLNDNTGHVALILGKDTSESMANLIIDVLEKKKREYMPGMKKLLILADGGGANTANGIQWTRELFRISDETQIELSMMHYPPGASKHNFIEHRLFGPISRNMAGVPALTVEQVAERIQGTTAVPKCGEKNPLKVYCVFDSRRYKSLSEKKKDPDYVVWTREYLETDPELMARITHPFEKGTDLYKWNYSITPKVSS